MNLFSGSFILLILIFVETKGDVQEAIDTARVDREEARRLVEEQTRELSRARQEAQHLLDETRGAADRLRQELVAGAEAEKADILERARREMDRERQRVLEQLREETVDISLAAAERLINETGIAGELEAMENVRGTVDPPERRKLAGLE